jgi:hypothetical protein
MWLILCDRTEGLVSMQSTLLVLCVACVILACIGGDDGARVVGCNNTMLAIG